MNFKIVFVIGLIACVSAQAPQQTVAQCLSKISADDGHVGKYAKADVKVATQANTQVKSGRLLAAVAETNTLTDLVKAMSLEMHLRMDEECYLVTRSERRSTTTREYSANQSELAGLSQPPRRWRATG